MPHNRSFEEWYGHKVNVTIRKFGRDSAMNFYFARLWKCTICEYERVYNLDGGSGTAYVIIHILSHADKKYSFYAEKFDNNSLYEIFMFYLRMGAAAYTTEEIEMRENIYDTALIYDRHYSITECAGAELCLLDYVTDACIFCEFKYMCMPSDEIAIEHAARCFSTLALKNTL